MATGSYCPQYFSASFKGVPFDAIEASSEHGRNGAEGEFVFGETTGFADLGRKIRRYPLSGRFPQNSHVGDAARLIAACESRGPGLLIHPTRGAVLVSCTTLKVRDNVLEEQGVTFVDLEFVEAGQTFGGLSITGSLFGISISAITIAARASFISSYRPSKARYYDTGRAVITAGLSISALRAEFATAIGAASGEQQYRVLSDFDDVIGATGSLKSAAYVFDAIDSGLKIIANATTIDNRFAAFNRVVNWAAKQSSLPGIGGESENAVYAAMRVMAGAQMARAALAAKSETLQGALDQFDKVAIVLDGEADIARSLCQEDLYLAIREFAITAKATMLDRAYNLPSIVSYNFSRSVHSLVAAYEIFDDAKRFGEIESRNGSAFPFLNGPSIVATQSP